MEYDTKQYDNKVVYRKCSWCNKWYLKNGTLTSIAPHVYETKHYCETSTICTDCRDNIHNY